MSKCEKCGHEQHGIAPQDGWVLVKKEPNADRMAIKLLVAAGFISEEKANEALSIAHGFSKGQLATAPEVSNEKL